MIKAVTRYSAEHLLALDKEFGQKRRRSLVTTIIIDILFLSIYIYYNYKFVYVYGYIKDLKPSLIIIAIYLIFTVRSRAKALGYRRRLARTEPSDKLCTFEFRENEFFMRSEKENYSYTVYIDYQKLISAHEAKNYFFIGTEPNKYAIIGKNELTEGSPDELRQLLQYKLGDKFKSYPEEKS